MLARHGDAIGALVAVLTVPLPPIAALAAHLTMPGTASLFHTVEAKGVPVGLTALPAKILAQQLLEGHALVSTGQSVGYLQLMDRESLICFDVLDRADGQCVYIHPVQRVLTVGAAAVFVTGLLVLETLAPIGLAVCFAVAPVFFFHLCLPLPVSSPHPKLGEQ